MSETFLKKWALHTLLLHAHQSIVHRVIPWTDKPISNSSDRNGVLRFRQNIFLCSEPSLTLKGPFYELLDWPVDHRHDPADDEIGRTCNLFPGLAER